MTDSRDINCFSSLSTFPEKLIATRPQIIRILNTHYQTGFALVQRGNQSAGFGFDFFLLLIRDLYRNFGINEWYGVSLL